MRYKEITDIDLLDLEEGWKDNIRKSAIAGAAALGLGTFGADMASKVISPDANASVNYSDHNTSSRMSQDFLDRMDKERAGHQVKKDGVHQNYPKELLGKEGEELKKTFIDKVTPMIKAENNKIMKERNHISKLIGKMSSGKDLSKEEREWMEAMHQKYKMDTWNPKELIKRVDIVPISIAISQAALESGWGTSRFAKEGNALFGQKTTSSKSIDRGRSNYDKFATFDGFDDSISSYINNLNTNNAYDAFRQQRAEMRKSGDAIDGKMLMRTLVKYSEGGKQYIKQVLSLMMNNGLDKLG